MSSRRRWPTHGTTKVTAFVDRGLGEDLLRTTLAKVVGAEFQAMPLERIVSSEQRARAFGQPGQCLITSDTGVDARPSSSGA